MAARRFAASLFCGVIALASAEFSGNALAQSASSDGARARDLCGAQSCAWLGLGDVASTGSLKFAPFDDASGERKAGIVAGLGVVGTAAVVVATTSGSDRVGAATLSGAATITPEPATLVLTATGLLLLIPVARAIRSR